MKTHHVFPATTLQVRPRQPALLTVAALVMVGAMGNAHAVDGGGTPNEVCVQVIATGEVACGTLSQAINGSATALGSRSMANQEATASGYWARASGFQSVAVGAFSLSADSGGTAIGAWSDAAELSSTAVGRSSYAAGRVSTAVGADSYAGAFRSTALGADARATAIYSTAAGFSSSAEGDYSSAFGGNSEAVGSSAIAIGSHSVATGTGSLSIGSLALSGRSLDDVLQGTAPTQGDIAIGQSAFTAQGKWNGKFDWNDTPVVARGGHAIALGTASQATATGAMALGAQSRASAAQSVALGQGSVADQPNTVSVGNPGHERRITNVAPGVAGTDAVNVDQLHAIDSKLQAMGSDLRTYAARTAAKALAMPSIPVLAPGETWAGLAAAHHDGQNAVGAAAAHQVNAHWNIGIGISTASSGDPSVKVQTGWKW